MSIGKVLTTIGPVKFRFAFQVGKSIPQGTIGIVLRETERRVVWASLKSRINLTEGMVHCELNDPVVVECSWSRRAAGVVDFLEQRCHRWFGIDTHPCPPPAKHLICGDFAFIPAARLQDIW